MQKSFDLRDLLDGVRPLDLAKRNPESGPQASGPQAYRVQHADIRRCFPAALSCRIGTSGTNCHVHTEKQGENVRDWSKKLSNTWSHCNNNRRAV